ncbi:SURF6-domain-containing protein [Saitoella complicata NRRL Y-17804]|uniref:SURF6-domain-containing protein n=1 Tax=Saitoella complicata (strain BCRC 22490 / CBS 7301 / JCM 7358 / NBRC 10748 / NRRL Y-17804) TaxID=698492 RepID=UPI0008682A25|nr:SURF6-domain-containing protein [Saitoella complicata NRRL Y-17804]ODQ51428.1 SURF6-domain-containing protein [Saitoella complicata NRRL Y-17804]
MGNELEDRLKAHNNAFEGLLSLIPSKYYHAEDSSSQWNKRKQSKEEAKKAKRAKLDPETTIFSAADTQAKKAAEAAKEAEQKDATTEAPATPAPSKGKKEPASYQKKAKNEHATPVQNGFAMKNAAKKQQNGEEKKVEEIPSKPEAGEDGWETDPQTPNKDSKKRKIANGSVSTTESTQQSQEAQTPANISELKAKLAAKIEALRAKRKAPGTGVEGAATSRTAMIEARKMKTDARKERKKAVIAEKRKSGVTVKDESDSDEEMEDVAPRPLSLGVNSDSVAFTRVQFQDGEELDMETGDARGKRKRKGPQDAYGALKSIQAKKARLAEMDEDKAQNIHESDTWRRAILQSQGEKVRDNEALLKKTVKRVEKEKKKSEKEWQERLANVRKTQLARQKKREENLKARVAGSKKGQKKAAALGIKPAPKKKRPGFEGTMRSGGKKGKK